MEKADLEKEAKMMNVIKVYGKQHVIRPVDRNFRNYKDLPSPDYMHTGQALVGILKKNETLKQFRANWVEGQTQLEEAK